MSYRSRRGNKKKQPTKLVNKYYEVVFQSEWRPIEDVGRMFGEVVNTVGALRKSALAEEPTFLIEHGVDIDLEKHREVREFHSTKELERYRKYLQRLLERTQEPRAIVCARPERGTIFEYWTSNDQTTIAIEVGRGGHYYRIRGFAKLPAAKKTAKGLPMDKLAEMMARNLRKIEGMSLEGEDTAFGLVEEHCEAIA